MAISFEDDVLAQMMDGVEKASQKSVNVWTFQIKDGEKALVRFLLDMRQAAVLWKHELYSKALNNGKGGYEVQAACARHDGVDVAYCKHCIAAKSNKKLTAKRSFIIPVYVYRIVNAKTGKPVTYKNQEGSEVEFQPGIRMLVLKETAPLLATLLSEYRELEAGDTFLTHDIVISRTDIGGDPLHASYNASVKRETQFVAPEGVEIPEQSAQAIIEQMLEKNPPDIVDGHSANSDDPGFPDLPPAQANKPAKPSVPDF